MKYSDRRPYLETAQWDGFWQRAQFDLRLKCFEIAERKGPSEFRGTVEIARDLERQFLETEWEGDQ